MMVETIYFDVMLNEKCRVCGEENKYFEIAFYKRNRKGKGNFKIISTLLNEDDLVCTQCMFFKEDGE